MFRFRWFRCEVDGVDSISKVEQNAVWWKRMVLQCPNELQRLQIDLLFNKYIAGWLTKRPIHQIAMSPPPALSTIRTMERRPRRHPRPSPSRTLRHDSLLFGFRGRRGLVLNFDGRCCHKANQRTPPPQRHSQQPSRKLASSSASPYHHQPHSP